MPAIAKQTKGYTFVNHNSNSNRYTAPVSTTRQSGGVPVTTFGTPASSLGFVSASGAVPPRQNKYVVSHRPSAVADVSDMNVAGVRTGEEVLVADPGAGAKRGSDAGTDDAVELKRRLAAARAEAKAANERLAKRKAEQGRAAALYALQLEEAEQRLAAERAAWAGHALPLLALAGRALRQTDRRRERELEGERDALLATVAELRAALEAQRAAHEERVRAAEEQRRGELESAQTQSGDEVRRLQEMIEALRQEMAAERARAVIERQELEARIAGIGEDLSRAQQAVKERDGVIARGEFLVAQCRLFIKNICQPDFAVVKDESLLPVDRDRPEPTGFVLVPLKVLLHGYTILPESERTDVITTYDNKMKQLKSK